MLNGKEKDNATAGHVQLIQVALVDGDKLSGEPTCEASNTHIELAKCQLPILMIGIKDCDVAGRTWAQLDCHRRHTAHLPPPRCYKLAERTYRTQGAVSIDQMKSSCWVSAQH